MPSRSKKIECRVYQRLGSNIRANLSEDLRAAVRRGILDNAGGRYSLLCRSIEEYTLDHLVKVLLAAIGSSWWSRDEAIVQGARHLGFRRTGRHIRAAFKSAIEEGVGRVNFKIAAEETPVQLKPCPPQF